MRFYYGAHGFSSEWVDDLRERVTEDNWYARTLTDLFGVEILLAVGTFLEKFSRTVTKEFMIRHLELKGTAVPSVV